jgi:hypothetical protein
MKGILGWFHNVISGDANRQQAGPELFKAGGVGDAYKKYLLNLYNEDTGQSKQFASQSTALRDALSQESGAQKDQFSMASNAGGFYDSGARLQGLNDINRSNLFSYSQGLTQILAHLEDQKLQAAYPFLQAQLGEYSAHEQKIANAQNEQNFRGAQLGSGISGAFSGGGGGAGSSLTGNQQSGGYT